MKVQLLGRRFALAVALGATATIAVETGFIASVAAQQRNQFYCDTSKSPPATVVRSPGGKKVPLISWTSNFFPPPLTPEQRCEKVSQRFQEFYNQNKLKYIITGKMNGQPVVCVANIEGGDCAGLLFTLKPGRDPGRILKTLLSRNALATSNVLDQSAGEQLYVNMEEFMKTELTDGNSAPSAGPAESGDTR